MLRLLSLRHGFLRQAVFLLLVMAVAMLPLMHDTPPFEQWLADAAPHQHLDIDDDAPASAADNADKSNAGKNDVSLEWPAGQAHHYHSDHTHEVDPNALSITLKPAMADSSWASAYQLFLPPPPIFAFERPPKTVLA